MNICLGSVDERTTEVEMCLDHCEWLWEAFSPAFTRLAFNPLALSPPQSSAREASETIDLTEGSAADLLPSEDAEEVSDEASGDRIIFSELLRRFSTGEIDEQRAASKELRDIARESPAKKILIARAGFIPLLVDLLSTSCPETQEHAVTTLLHLSMIKENKKNIVRAGAVDAIVEVLKCGSIEARENAAATLFSLSLLDENKVTIGSSRVFPALVDLLKDGTMRGKNDAASALFNLSLDDANRLKAVEGGVLPPLVNLLRDTEAGMMDVSLAILSLFASDEDCVGAVTDAYPILALIDLIKSPGSSGTIKENCLDVLLALAQNSPTEAALAKQLGASPCVAELARSGIPRVRRKASELLSLFNQTEHEITICN